MALIDISLPKSIARALRLPTNSAKRQQMRVLKKLLKKETKAFIDGLEHGISVAELEALRAGIKEISEALEEKIKSRGNSSG